jgi:hypothetical protein
MGELPTITITDTSDIGDIFSTPWPFDRPIGGGPTPQDVAAHWATRERNVSYYLEGKKLGAAIPTFYQTAFQLRMAQNIDLGLSGPFAAFAMDVNANGANDLLGIANLATGQVITSTDGTNWRQGW